MERLCHKCLWSPKTESAASIRGTPVVRSPPPLVKIDSTKPHTDSDGISVAWREIYVFARMMAIKRYYILNILVYRGWG